MKEIYSLRIFSGDSELGFYQKRFFYIAVLSFIEPKNENWDIIFQKGKLKVKEEELENFHRRLYTRLKTEIINMPDLGIGPATPHKSNHSYITYFEGKRVDIFYQSETHTMISVLNGLRKEIEKVLSRGGKREIVLVFEFEED